VAIYLAEQLNRIHTDLVPRAEGPASALREGTLGELRLTEGSNVSHLAGQLTQRWNQSIWGQIAKILENPAAYAAGDTARASSRPRQFQRRLSEETWDKIIAEYQAGASATSLGKNYGIDDETIRRRLRTLGITPRPPREATFTGDRLQEAQALRANGATYTEIGLRFGVNRQTAANALQKAARQGNT
jgi:hypothetical protein